MFEDIIDLEYRSVPHEGKLYTRPVTSTNIRQAILERNHQLRINPGAQQDLAFGRQVLAIPVLDDMLLKKKEHERASRDKQIRGAALAKICASSESAPYKVR